MAHETLLKFNYPRTLLKEYRHWAVLLRPKQVTLGSLVLTCTEDATSMSEVTPAAFSELKTVSTRGSIAGEDVKVHLFIDHHQAQVVDLVIRESVSQRGL